MAERGSYAKTAARREQILDAALRIIGDNGYSGTSLQQIADAVGLSKAGLLHHFGSRDALFTAVLERRDTVSGVSETTDDAVEGFLEAIRHNATVPGLVALYSAYMAEGVTDGNATLSREFLSRRYPMAIALLAGSLAAHQAAGDIRSDADPVAIARLLVAAADGLQTQWLLDDSVDMAGDLERLLDAFRAG